MDTGKIDVKIFTEQGLAPDLSELVPVFHGWIQQRRVPDELLIDVANYAHVPDGPGVMLIGHEAHYGLDMTGGQPGLLYSQRRPPVALDFAQALRRALCQALRACSMLESETTLSKRLSFRTDRWLLRLNDRLHAANEPALAERAAPACRAVLGQIFGAEVQLEPLPAGRERLGFHVVTGVRPSLSELLARL